jgi:hypothetical protein
MRAGGARIVGIYMYTESTPNLRPIGHPSPCPAFAPPAERAASPFERSGASVTLAGVAKPAVRWKLGLAILRHKGQMSRQMAVDTAIAIALVFLLFGLNRHERWAVRSAAATLVAALVAPSVFRYPAAMWLELGRGLGAASSRLIVGLLFFFIVAPVGLLQRLTGKDRMLRRRWRRDGASVFHRREKTFTPADLIKPY